MPSLHPNELTMLLELSEALGSPLNLRGSFARALEIVETDLKSVFGMVMFLDAETGDLKVEAATGSDPCRRPECGCARSRPRLREEPGSRASREGARDRGLDAGTGDARAPSPAHDREDPELQGRQARNRPGPLPALSRNRICHSPVIGFLRIDNIVGPSENGAPRDGRAPDTQGLFIQIRRDRHARAARRRPRQTFLDESLVNSSPPTSPRHAGQRPA